MKKIYINILSMFVIATGIISCNDELDINRDPDSLSQNGVAMSTEFPVAIAGVAGAQGSYGALVGGFWSQYWTQSNSSNQYKTIDDYSMLGTSAINNGLWRNMYDALGDIRNVKGLAKEEGNWNYYLMATTLEVYASQIITDFFDQIPYSEANNPEILTPVFDQGSDVYDQLIVDLNDALSKNLAASTGETPGADDLIFGGNMSNWTAFANTLKLKIYLRQENNRPGVTASGIQALLNSNASFLSVDAALTQFEDAPDKSNPLFESNERQLNTPNNLRASTTLYSYLSQNSDPRLDNYYEEGNSLDQGDYNSSTAQNSISIVNLNPTTAVYFISAEESLFMQAEANLKYGSESVAQSKYESAVDQAFSTNGEDASSFLAAGGAYEYPTSGSQDEKLTAIITQKWISAFPGNGYEAFFDTNRTGIPAISSVPQSSSSYIPGQLSYSVTGTTGGKFPKRLQYPSDVRARNQNAPSNVAITEPVWWAN